MPSTSATTLSPPPPATGSAGLPRDVLWSIFVRLGQHEVLQSTSLACVAWWRFARGVDLTPPAVDVARPLCCSDHSDDDCSIGDWMFDEAAAADDGGQEEHCHSVMGWKAMARAAVDRSAGQCEAFCGRADDDVLLYLADRAPSLRSLQVTTHYDVSSNLLSELIKKLPLLEELELVLRSDSTYTTNTTTCRQTYSSNWAELLISTCQSCRHLNRFTVRRVGREPDAESWNYWKRRDLKSSKPSWMPTMHKLRSLVLCGDSFTKCLVLRIVDSCPNLKSLDIRKVWSINVIWDTEFEDKCSWIKDLHLPYHYYDRDESECYL